MSVLIGLALSCAALCTISSDTFALVARFAELLKTTPDSVVKKAQALLDERRALEKRLEEAMRGGGDELRRLVEGASAIDGVRAVSSLVKVPDVKALQALGDAVREQTGPLVAALGATFDDQKSALLVVVTDGARERGVRADEVVRELAAQGLM